jgi:hypothetical protein
VAGIRSPTAKVYRSNSRIRLNPPRSIGLNFTAMALIPGIDKLFLSERRERHHSFEENSAG